jgi:hypothetical protein
MTCLPLVSVSYTSRGFSQPRDGLSSVLNVLALQYLLSLKYDTSFHNHSTIFQLSLTGLLVPSLMWYCSLSVCRYKERQVTEAPPLAFLCPDRLPTGAHFDKAVSLLLTQVS